MPHIVIEQSADVADKIAPDALCKLMFDAAASTGVFGNPAAIKVRVHTAQAVLMGTETQSFVHVDVRMLAGRTDAQKASVTAAVLGALVTALSDVGNLSVDTQDLHDGSYTKRVL